MKTPKTSERHIKPSKKATPYREWETYDLGILGLLLTSTIILLVLAGVNVVALLIGSGNSLFVSTPLLAWLMAAILPCTSIAVKSGYHLLVLDRSRHTYAWIVFILAGIFALIWIVLFAISFEGSSGGGIDYESMGEPNHEVLIDKIRTLVQILAEIMVGSSLFLIIDRLHAKYSNAVKVEADGWRESKETSEKLRDMADVLTELADNDEAVVIAYESARAVFVAQSVGYLRDT